MKKINTFLKIFLIRLVFFLYNPFKKKVKETKNVLIISMTGLGDTLWATPAIKALKDNEPQTKIFVLTHEVGEQILKNSPYIEKIIVWKKPFIFHFFSLLALRKISFSKVFVFHISQRIALILLGFLQTKEVIGQEKINKGMDFLFTKLLSTKKTHEVNRRFQQVGYFPKTCKLDFFLKEDEKAKAKLFLLSLGIDLKKPLILIHPGSKDRYRCYPIENLIKAAKGIQKKFPAQFYLSGSKEEKDLIDPLNKNIPNSFISPSPLSIREFAAVMGKTDLVITNDTGPIHLACSVDVFLIALFSPSDPSIKGPISEKAHILYRRKSCKKCYERKCLEPFCLYQIPVHDIVLKSTQLLKTSYATKSRHHLSQL